MCLHCRKSKDIMKATITEIAIEEEDVRILANAHESPACAKLLEAIQRMRDYEAGRLATNAKINTEIIRDDIRCKIGGVEKLDWVLSIPGVAREEMKKARKQRT